MNLPSDADRAHGPGQTNYLAGAAGTQEMAPFLAAENSIAPFEFRLLTGEDAEELAVSIQPGNAGTNGRNGNGRPTADKGPGSARGAAGTAHDCSAREAQLRDAIDAAMKEGLEKGEREGRRAMRAEMEAEMNMAVTRERQCMADAVHQFRGARERYFGEVEQEVVKLALAIAARVLHREAQIDPLLLAGVVRVALEKMADRSGVVLRVAGADVEAWERVFHSVEASERPRVAEDAGLERGECVLDTKMGTVELGVRVQLEEIEKGFFDLLNHRPTE